MSPGRLAAALAAAAAAALALPAGAGAHGLVGKQTLPVPNWLVAWGAAIVLVASFAALALLWREPRLERARERPLLTVPRALEILAGAAGLFAFAVSVYAGLRGVQNAHANLLPTVVYVHFWVAVPLLSLLLGDVFAAFSPWRAIGRAAGWLAARLGQPAEPLPYPARLGRWPAAIGILAFAWVELVFDRREDPSTLAVMALAYMAVQLVGMALYGERQWTRNADPFAVYFGLFARLAPVRWHGRRVVLRAPGTAVTGLGTGAGTLALVLISIGTTSFDGLTQTGGWPDVATRLSSWVGSLGVDPRHALELAFTVGLLGAVAIVSAFYLLGVRGMRVAGPRIPSTWIGVLARAYAPALVPIALAYVVAHYFSLLAYQGQAIAYLVSDPLGHGANLLGTADVNIDYQWITSNGVWYVQVGAILVGHVTGLVLAHDRALALHSDPRSAARSQRWMLAVMVGFTMLALWLVSAASGG